MGFPFSAFSTQPSCGNPTEYFSYPHANVWSANLNSAYELIRKAEAHAVAQNQKDQALNARVVGYLLLECVKRTHWIVGSHDDRERSSVGKL